MISYVNALYVRLCVLLCVYLCSGELSITSTSCATPSRTSTVLSLTCRRRLRPEMTVGGGAETETRQEVEVRMLVLTCFHVISIQKFSSSRHNSVCAE